VWLGEVVAFFCFLYLPLAGVHASTLNRSSEAVILSGGSFPAFIGTSIETGENALFLYAYDQALQTWRQIPFQWDQRDTSGSFFNPAGDEILGLDSNDELVFMALDAGDRALTSWIADLNSQTFLRYEIQITDPLEPSSVGWVYLYKSLTLQQTFEQDYVTYVPSQDPNTGEDFIESDVYKIGGNAKGIFGFLSLQPNPTVNLLDRQKIRGRTTLFGAFDEESDLGFVHVTAVDGPVRVIREITLELVNLLEVSLPLQYFRDSVVLEGNLSIPQEIKFLFFTIKVQEIRHSIDLSAAASGMEMFNPNNSSVPINGENDPNVNKQIDFLPDVNYVHITGDQGTIINLFEIPDTIGDTRQLYYKDQLDTNDPGDGDSYGDSGVLITGQDIDGEFPLALKLVFRGPNQPSSVASALADYEENPLTVSLMPQAIGAVPVELASFTAAADGNDVHLHWVTVTETDNFGFDVERKDAAEIAWQRIGFVHGAGTTSAPEDYDFYDLDLAPGAVEYRLKQIDTDGSFEYSQTVAVAIGLPGDFVLHQNYPNPFNPSTEIRYEIPARQHGDEAAPTELTVYNLLGEKVVTLVREQQPPGFYALSWDGLSGTGQRVASGVYLYVLRSGEFTASRKMLLVR